MFRSEWLTLTIAFLAITIATFPALAAEPQAGPIVIRNVSVFDSINGVMLSDRTIVIANGHIQAIGSPQHPVKAPSGARTIKARGKYVIPGLIDSHSHLTLVYDFGHTTSYDVLPLFLANGVTSVRDVGDDIMAEAFVARYSADHPDLAPRVFLASPLIDGDPPFHPGLGWNAVITDPAKVPAFVDDMAAWGVITLKIYARTGRAVGRKVIEEAHRHGMVVTGHLSEYSPLDAAEDGIDCIEHISAGSLYGYLSARMTPPGAEVDLNSPIVRELVAALLAHKVMVDPTLVVFRNMLLLPDLPGVAENPENDFVPKSLREFWPTYSTPEKPETLADRKKEFRKYEELTGLLFHSGVPLLAGTDEPEPNDPPGFSLHEELELLVESGLPPAAALQAATINPARIVKQEKELGSIEEGKWADLVILDADPLQDVKNTRKIYKVIREGLISDPQDLLRTVRSTVSHSSGLVTTP